MAGTPKLIAAPAFIGSSIANVFTPNAALRYQITHIHVTNQTGGAVTFSLGISTTGDLAAGKEIVKDYSLAAKGTSGANFDIYNVATLDGAVASNFLTAVASAGSSLVITVEGFIFAA